MKTLYLILFSTYLLLVSTASFAQNVADGETPGMATGMRANGKIYVVIAVVVTIVLGLFLYLANLDKKIKKLEKDIK